ncbi:TlpA disulfide reductase family protein [Intestinimonas sp.]|uniref:TlpA family protein disulfide reductase n=1 Tax=Intestinimonas sp. TaxID=1965293 RepID=UPI0026232E77|nr:TlpA disulfide reductase family protein [Intestinimonas sp.]
MKKKTSFLVLILVLAALIGGAYVLYGRLSADAGPGNLAAQTPQGSDAPEETEPPKVEAPDFTATDAEGTEVKLSDYVGKPIVLNFWASWCPPCKSEMPDFHDAWEELDGEVQFLMVNATDGGRETVETAKEYVEGQGFSFPVLFDTGMEAASAYGAYSLPTTYFIDAEGYVVAGAKGAIDRDTLQKGIDLIYTEE